MIANQPARRILSSAPARRCALLAAALALAGCGGGSGGGGGAPTVSGNIPPEYVPAIGRQMRRAASAEGQESSYAEEIGGIDPDTVVSGVSQSSRFLVSAERPSNDDIDVIATVELTAGKKPFISVINNFGDGGGGGFSGEDEEPWDQVDTENDETTRITEPDTPIGIVHRRTIRAKPPAEDPDSFSETEPTGVVVVDVFTNRFQGEGITDYLAAGTWIYWPANPLASPNDIVVGAFASGAKPVPHAHLPTSGTAIYDGYAIGLYVEDNAGDTSLGEFSADVTLEATFNTGETGTISGTVDEFTVGGAGANPLADLTLNLGSATITENLGTEEARFAGDTSVTNDDSREYTGKWIGEFYNSGGMDTVPGYAAGTFGAATGTEADHDYDLSIIGAFGAKERE